MGRSRGGLTSKIHAAVDSRGLSVRVALLTGEAHDNRLVVKLLSRLKSGATLLADRGYDADWIRALISQRGAWANTRRKNRAVVQATVATFGSLSVDETNKTLIMSPETSMFPNQEGEESKRPFSVTGDELKWTVPAQALVGEMRACASERSRWRVVSVSSAVGHSRH